LRPYIYTLLIPLLHTFDLRLYPNVLRAQALRPYIYTLLVPLFHTFDFRLSTFDFFYRPDANLSAQRVVSGKRYLVVQRKT
jgi:hypothetical protein